MHSCSWYLYSPFYNRWMSILNNAKEQQLLLAFSDDKDGTIPNENLRELQKQIVSEIRKLPGNNICCDCGAKGYLYPCSPHLFNAIIDLCCYETLIYYVWHEMRLSMRYV